MRALSSDRPSEAKTVRTAGIEALRQYLFDLDKLELDELRAQLREIWCSMRERAKMANRLLLLQLIMCAFTIYMLCMPASIVSDENKRTADLPGVPFHMRQDDVLVIAPFAIMFVHWIYLRMYYVTTRSADVLAIFQAARMPAPLQRIAHIRLAQIEYFGDLTQVLPLETLKRQNKWINYVNFPIQFLSVIGPSVFQTILVGYAIWQLLGPYLSESMPFELDAILLPAALICAAAWSWIVLFVYVLGYSGSNISPQDGELSLELSKLFKHSDR
jgi:hypothetical protein